MAAPIWEPPIAASVAPLERIIKSLMSCMLNREGPQKWVCQLGPSKLTSGLSIAMQDPRTCDVLFFANPVSKEVFFFTPGTDRTIASMVPCKVPRVRRSWSIPWANSISYDNSQIHLKHLWEKNSGVSIDIVVFQYFPIFPSVNPGVDDNSMIHHLEEM